MRILAEEVKRGVGQMLAQSGWVESSSGDEEYIVFEKRKRGGLSFLVGFDLSVRKYGLSLNPSVGIRHDQISHLVGELYGLSDGGWLVGATLADLFDAEGREGGQLPRWVVLPSDRIDMVVDLVKADLDAHAVPYMEAYEDIRDVAREIRTKKTSTHFDLGRLAVIDVECGDLRSASEYIRKLESLARKEPPFVVEQIETFINNFRTRYGC
ncbi:MULTISPECIES: hypothetical protein [unclassified Micromonospora]|uniref:hypothetical protein n=1 Tax=unclassified Micromonospora TaxID=2617518 RepID=UPI003A8BADD1